MRFGSAKASVLVRLTVVPWYFGEGVSSCQGGNARASEQCLIISHVELVASTPPNSRWFVQIHAKTSCRTVPQELHTGDSVMTVLTCLDIRFDVARLQSLR